MAITIHVADIGLVNVANGRPFLKSSDAIATFKDVMLSNTEHRILKDPANPNTNNFPKLRDYLNLEATAGFQVVQVLQGMVITQKLS